jgi:hypothetical protein
MSQGHSPAVQAQSDRWQLAAYAEKRVELRGFELQGFDLRKIASLFVARILA